MHTSTIATPPPAAPTAPRRPHLPLRHPPPSTSSQTGQKHAARQVSVSVSVSTHCTPSLSPPNTPPSLFIVAAHQHRRPTTRPLVWHCQSSSARAKRLEHDLFPPPPKPRAPLCGVPLSPRRSPLPDCLSLRSKRPPAISVGLVCGLGLPSVKQTIHHTHHLVVSLSHTHHQRQDVHRHPSHTHTRYTPPLRLVDSSTSQLHIHSFHPSHSRFKAVLALTVPEPHLSIVDFPLSNPTITTTTTSTPILSPITSISPPRAILRHHPHCPSHPFSNPCRSRRSARQPSLPGDHAGCGAAPLLSRSASR